MRLCSRRAYAFTHLPVRPLWRGCALGALLCSSIGNTCTRIARLRPAHGRPCITLYRLGIVRAPEAAAFPVPCSRAVARACRAMEDGAARAPAPRPHGRERPDWLGAVVAIYEGEHRKHFSVLSYTHPVYMLREQERAPNPRMHFYICTSKDGTANSRMYPLFDTIELTADDYLHICKTYHLRNVSACAGPNDETAVLFAAGFAPT